jgi:4-amino-4-deoxy-L-arabinose transferase-like glycosyltransferase
VAEACRRAWNPHVLAASLILPSTVLSFVYVCWLTPLTLSPDEAHYWDWSRNLDWSYYSKGPLIAWLIWASCELFGSLSIALTGDLAAALRLPAVVCHGCTLAGWYALAVGVFRSRAVGLGVLACAITLPMVRAGAVLMTIDPPFLLCWCWALVCVWRALETDRLRWWVGAAALTGIGILAKYTMALFPAAIVGFLLFHRRSEFRKPGVWLLVAGTALGWLPVVVWNAQHDWVSFRHVFGQVGVAGHKAGGVFHFLGGQLGMLFGFWLIAFLAAAWRFRPTRETESGVRLLWWASVPVWSLFLAASVVKSGQPNWPAPAYIGAIVLAVAWTRDQLAGRRPLLMGFWLTLSTLAGCVIIAGLHFPDLLRPTLAKFAKPPTPHNPYPMRNIDITARIAGWEELADEVDAVRARVRAETGCEPVVAGTHWTVPGLMGFYCDDNPAVYAIGIANRSDRHSQYDVWRPNPVADAQEFRGRTFVIVGDIGVEVMNAFERVESPRRVVHTSNGIPLSGGAVWVCHGFRGFAPAAPPSTGSHY